MNWISSAYEATDPATNVLFDRVWIHDILSKNQGDHTDCIGIDHVDGVTIRNSTIERCQHFSIIFGNDFDGMAARNVLLENNLIDCCTTITGVSAGYYAIGFGGLDGPVALRNNRIPRQGLGWLNGTDLVPNGLVTIDGNTITSNNTGNCSRGTWRNNLIGSGKCSGDGAGPGAVAGPAPTPTPTPVPTPVATPTPVPTPVADADAGAHAGGDADAGAHAGRDADAGAHAGGDAHARAHPDRDPDADLHADADARTGTCAGAGAGSLRRAPARTRSRAQAQAQVQGQMTTTPGSSAPGASTRPTARPRSTGPAAGTPASSPAPGASPAATDARCPSTGRTTWSACPTPSRST